MFLSKSDLLQDLQMGFVDYLKDSCLKKQLELSLLPGGSFCVTVHSETKLTVTLRLPER